jgi:hypothetical protein
MSKQVQFVIYGSVAVFCLLAAIAFDRFFGRPPEPVRDTRTSLFTFSERPSRRTAAQDWKDLKEGLKQGQRISSMSPEEWEKKVEQMEQRAMTPDEVRREFEEVERRLNESR